MSLPVASCLVCGEEKELAVWVDPAVTGGSFHGVCFQCRHAAQQSVQATVATPWACPSCSHENHAMAIKCYFCDATAPNA